VVKHLERKKKLSGAVSAACIRTLSLIGGDAAYDMLEGYASDTREVVVDELLKAWDAFDREKYAKSILSKAVENRSELSFTQLSSLDGIQYLTNLTSLNLIDCSQLSDISALAGLTNLTRLGLAGCSQLNDISALAQLTNLISLDLRGCSQLSDISALAQLTNLTSLNLKGCNRLNDISVLARLTNLTLEPKPFRFKRTL
jgi:hypothetical protein